MVLDHWCFIAWGLNLLNLRFLIMQFLPAHMFIYSFSYILKFVKIKLLIAELDISGCMVLTEIT
jgi:hypothetical protein